MRTFEIFFSALLISVVVGCASGPRDTFTDDGVANGSIGDQVECKKNTPSIWVVVDGKGDCIRYFLSKSKRAPEVAIVYLHGDEMAQSPSDAHVTSVYFFHGRTPAAVQAFVDARGLESEFPYIFLSRPGTYGSTGDHKDRRQEREVKLVGAALDSIKENLGVRKFVLSGLSGGGHLVGALLSRRNDIKCAVIGSGVVSIASRNQLRGWTRDITGYSSFVDPIREVGGIKVQTAPKIFVLGDSGDQNVPFETQRAYYDALLSRGLEAYLIPVRGRGTERHILTRPIYDVARWCSSDVPYATIRQNIELAN